jgi:predicted ATPase
MAAASKYPAARPITIVHCEDALILGRINDVSLTERAMIQQVSIKNFKCLRDVTIDLEPLTLFVGTNGSGKTSVLEAIDLMCRALQTRGSSPEAEFHKHRSVGVSSPVAVSVTIDGSCYIYQSDSASNQRQPSGVAKGFYYTTDPNSRDWGTPFPVNPVLESTLWIKLDVNALRSADRGGGPKTMMPTGSGLHSATASIGLEDPEKWLRMQDDLRKIVPAVKRIRHTAERELLFDTISGKSLKAHQVSEGTLLTLGLLMAINLENRPNVLLLDDLDRGLHPKAQRDLIALLRGVQKTNPEVQIIGTTHSPYMLDELDANEVRVMALQDDGSSACQPLTNHPEYQKWKKEFSAGDMWSFFGEGWVNEKAKEAEALNESEHLTEHEPELAGVAG